MRLGSLAMLLLFGCATTSAQLTSEAPQCESFASYDEKIRQQLDVLLTGAPGDALVRESSRLNTARRTCARHVISGLLTLRETRGVEAAQQEIDALSATYRADDLRALMSAAIGSDLSSIEPLMAEARTRVKRRDATAGAERRDEREREKLKPEETKDFGAPPEVPETMCDEAKPCEQLKCLAETLTPTLSRRERETSARGCLDEVTALEPPLRAKRASEVLALLPSTPSPARTEARMMLDTLRAQLWPQVDAAIAARQPGRAAQLASLFLSLPSASERAEQLRDQAQAHHLARAKDVTGNASWLHRKLAEELGGPEAPPLDGVGHWEKPRLSRCNEPLPPMPELPAGLGATLTLRCMAPEAPAKKQSGEMRTFEMESSLRGQKLDVSLYVTCADRGSTYSLTVEDPGVEGFPKSALEEQLTKTIERAVTDCARIHEFAAPRSCAELRKKSPSELINRFVEHARFNHRWEPCFEEWLLTTEGVSPPSPP